MTNPKRGRLLLPTVVLLSAILTGVHESNLWRGPRPAPPGLVAALLEIPLEWSDWRANLRVLRLPETADDEEVPGADEVPALWRELDLEPKEDARRPILKQIVASGTLDDERKAVAIEEFSRRVVAAGGLRDRPGLARFLLGNTPLPVDVSLGRYLSESEAGNVRLATILVGRERELRRSDPAVAEILGGILYTWPVQPAGRALLDRLDRGDATTSTVVAAVERADLLRATEYERLEAMVERGSCAGGVAAALLADDATARRVLASEDRSAIGAMLACARLIEIPLPVDLVGALLDASGETAYAARRYLEVEDGPEARRLLLAHAPEPAHVVGRRISAWNDDVQSRVVATEERLRREVLSDGGPHEILALLPGIVVRVWPDRAEITDTVYEYPRKVPISTTRALAPEELAELTRFLRENRVDDLSSYAEMPNSCWAPPTQYQYLRLSREGGTRVDFQLAWGGAYDSDPVKRVVYDELSKRFERLAPEDTAWTPGDRVFRVR